MQGHYDSTMRKEIERERIEKYSRHGRKSETNAMFVDDKASTRERSRESVGGPDNLAVQKVNPPFPGTKQIVVVRLDKPTQTWYEWQLGRGSACFDMDDVGIPIAAFTLVDKFLGGGEDGIM